MSSNVIGKFRVPTDNTCNYNLQNLPVGIRIFIEWGIRSTTDPFTPLTPYTSILRPCNTEACSDKPETEVYSPRMT